MIHTALWIASLLFLSVVALIGVAFAIGLLFMGLAFVIGLIAGGLAEAKNAFKKTISRLRDLVWSLNDFTAGKSDKRPKVLRLKSEPPVLERLSPKIRSVSAVSLMSQPVLDTALDRLAELEADRKWRDEIGALTVYRDGDQWCVVKPDFVDLGKSEAWFDGDLFKAVEAASSHLKPTGTR